MLHLQRAEVCWLPSAFHCYCPPPTLTSLFRPERLLKKKKSVEWFTFCVCVFMINELVWIWRVRFEKAAVGGNAIPGAARRNMATVLGSLIKTHSHFPQHWVCNLYNSISHLLLQNRAQLQPTLVFVSKLSTLLLDVWEEKPCAATKPWAIREANTREYTLSLWVLNSTVLPGRLLVPLGVTEASSYHWDPGTRWGQQNLRIRYFHRLIQ